MSFLKFLLQIFYFFKKQSFLKNLFYFFKIHVQYIKGCCEKLWENSTKNKRFLIYLILIIYYLYISPHGVYYEQDLTTRSILNFKKSGFSTLSILFTFTSN